MTAGTAAYSEIWVCFNGPSRGPVPGVLLLSFLHPGEEGEVQGRWGEHFISGRQLTQDVREEARSAYIELIARVGATPVNGLTFREALKGEDGTSRWWLLKTTEKDCVWGGDPTYNILIQLFCVRRVAERYGVCRVRTFGGPREFSTALASRFGTRTGSSGLSLPAILWICVTGLLRRVVFLVRSLWTWRLVKKVAPRRTGPLDVIFEAYWDWSVGRGPDGMLQDRYFTDLPEQLSRRGVRVGWMAWCEPFNAPWQKGRRLRDVVASGVGSGDVIFMERYLTPGDILRAVLTLRYLAEYLRFDRLREFRSLFVAEGFDLYPLLSQQIARLLSGWNLCRWELQAIAADRVCREVRPGLLLTFLELFVQARANCVGARRASPNVSIWAAQHAAYASDKSFGVVHPTEFRGVPDGCPLPCPDGIFVMGELARSMWVGNGLRSNQVVVTGGLRYQHVGIRNGWRARDRNRRTILLLASMNEALELEMCEAIVAAAAGLPEFHIMLRDHPHFGIARRKAFGRYRDRIVVTTGSVDEDLAMADLVMFTHSSLAEEALLQGIPTWQWLWAGFNTSVFLDLPVIPTFTSVGALRQELRSFLDHPEKYRPTREVQDTVLRQCFGPAPAEASRRIADLVLEIVGRTRTRSAGASR